MPQEKEYPLCLVCKIVQRKIFTYKNFSYWKCPECFFASTYPFPNKKVIYEHYKNKFNTGNYQLFQKFSNSYMEVYKDFANRLEKYLKKNKQSIQNKKILDIGCFTGDFLEILMKRGADIHGLELQKDAVKIANKRLGGRKVLQKNVMENFSSNSPYDVITLLGVVEHVTSPIVLIKKSARLLKKNGVIMIQTPNSMSLLARVLGKFWPPYAPVEHIHFFSRKSLTMTLKQEGFTDIVYQQSWKKLPILYVFLNMQNFGPEFYNLIKPFLFIFNKFLPHVIIPFYGGEMIIMARKE